MREILKTAWVCAVFTDEIKMDVGTGAVVYLMKGNAQIPDKSSVLQAEILAIIKTLLNPIIESSSMLSTKQYLRSYAVIEPAQI